VSNWKVPALILIDPRMIFEFIRVYNLSTVQIYKKY
jgi:hypothetical protein